MAKELVYSNMTVTRDNEDVDIWIDGYVEYEIDNSYGEDADGNRGVSRTTVIDVLDLGAYEENGSPFILTKHEKINAEELLVRKLFNR